MDDTSPERRLMAKITMIQDSPPTVVITPRNPRVGTEMTADDGMKDGIEFVNKEEVVNALIQGLWIVWREMVVTGINSGKRASLKLGSRKRGVLDVLLCR